MECVACCGGRPPFVLFVDGSFDIMERSVPRELLPLPPVTVTEVAGLGSRGRRLAQRVQRRKAADTTVNELVWALNELNGQGHFDSRRRLATWTRAASCALSTRGQAPSV